MEYGSRDVAKVAVMMALTGTREEEHNLQAKYKERGFRCCAVDFGGDFTDSVSKMIERSVVAAKREGVIGESHVDIGAVAGAAREAVSQIAQKAIGYSVGGKIGIAGYDMHIVVAVYLGIGLLHLNDVAIGLAHRVV